ncbi:hypothetical protein [Streptomyces sp. PsTaAH-124]|uniref:hypothetical protein n=1 Tax=Streptomyces sp. PsTaAH-124 TaxID=1157638 RepID=UPI0006846A6B|nr:hypothetical protein [Streptomyces sp. PsTaAH-124]
MPYHSYDYGSRGDDCIDLKNVPKNAVTVTVSISDERLKNVVEGRLKRLKEAKKRHISMEQWEAVARGDAKIKILEIVLIEAGIS